MTENHVNSLPPSIHALNSYLSFGSALKTHLFSPESPLSLYKLQPLTFHGLSSGACWHNGKTPAYQSNGSEFKSGCRLATPLSKGDLSPLGSDPDDFCGRRNGR